MKDFKRTKCKWHAIEYAGRYTVQSGAYYGDMDIPDYENFSKEEVDANAKLIAAAPELLEAPMGLLRITDDSHGVSGYHLNDKTALWNEFPELELAEKAISKAIGE